MVRESASRLLITGSNLGLGHRVTTVIEEQRLVVLGDTALLTKVGQLHIHMIGKRGGKMSYL